MPLQDRHGHTRALSNDSVRQLYDSCLPEGQRVRDIVFPEVFGPEQYIGQFSDNTVDQIDKLAAKADITAENHVLDIGCGCCGPAIYLAKKTGCRITGVDVSVSHSTRGRVAVEKAQLADRIQIINRDIFEIADSLEPADVVIGLGAWCHMAPRDLFPVSKNLLKPGGRIAFMERVKLGAIDHELYEQLTTDWASPSVETFASYYFALRAAGFNNIFIEDLTSSYKELQQKFIQARINLHDKIEQIAGREYYELDLNLVRAEVNAAQAGNLGYGLFVGHS
jgi:cyclopropane fatty-acyl-phospholipid synthase-like methyltransferase